MYHETSPMHALQGAALPQAMLATGPDLPDGELTQLDRRVKDWEVKRPLHELSTDKKKEAVNMLTELHLLYIRTPSYVLLWNR